MNGADIVVDIGCTTHGGDNSIDPLITQFEPTEYYGFDPQAVDDTYTRHGCLYRLRKLAAWVDDDGIRMGGRGLGLGVRYEDGDYDTYPTFILSRFIHNLPIDHSIVLKLDCEGAEWQLIPHLIETGAAERITLLLTEWHCLTCMHGAWSHAHGCEDNGLSERKAEAIEARWPGEHGRWEL